LAPCVMRIHSAAALRLVLHLIQMMKRGRISGLHETCRLRRQRLRFFAACRDIRFCRCDEAATRLLCYCANILRFPHRVPLLRNRNYAGMLMVDFVTQKIAYRGSLSWSADDIFVRMSSRTCSAFFLKAVLSSPFLYG